MNGASVVMVIFLLVALGAGMVFLVVVAIVLSPVVHRALHRFHLEGGT